MKISGRVDGSACAAVLSNRPSAAFRKAITGGRALCTAKDASKDVPKKRVGKSFFCSQSSLWIASTFMPNAEPRPSISIPRRKNFASKGYSTAAAAAATVRPISYGPSAPVTNKDELLSYVEPDEGDVDEYFDYHRDPFRRGFAAGDGPRLQVSEKREDMEYPERGQTYTADDGVKQLVTKLCTSIGSRLRYPHRVSLDSIYKTYSKLPEPRMLHLTGQWRSRLLRVVGTPPKRDNESMLRYFALVADVKNAGLSLRRSQWNYALTFATKYVTRAGPQEMESALRLWKQMEREARVPGNDVTFNVLFDVASKAGNFLLAEMIYKEMDNRGIEFNRFHHVSLIHYFGLKLDSGGVRAAYKEMVESGEMIDTVVLNSVISGLLRCGEESAAEETYQRMKNGNTPAIEMPERNYMTNKVVSKVLMMFSRIGKEHPQLKEKLQTNVQLAPDLRTYRLLVDHFAIKVGDLGKVAQYLDEMKFIRIPLHPTIFLALFKGFFVHGGYEDSSWSMKRLDDVLQALYQAHDEHTTNFRIDRWVVIWALRAVKKCFNSNDAVHTVFDELSQRWDIPPDRQGFMHGLLENIVQNRDLTSDQRNWEKSLYRGFRTDETKREEPCISSLT